MRLELCEFILYYHMTDDLDSCKVINFDGRFNSLNLSHFTEFGIFL